MPENDAAPQHGRLGRIVSIAIVAGALITGLLVINRDQQIPANRRR